MAGLGRRRFLAGALAAPLALGPRAARAAARPFDANLATVGNSLTDESVDIVHFFARSRGGQGALGRQSIPGAPLQWNWDHAHEAYDLDGRALLAGGGQRLWLGVESVPFRHLQGPGEPCDIRAWDRWARLAGDGGVERIGVFEAWHDLDSGRPGYVPEDRADPDTGLRWRERLDAARPHWAAISDRLEARRRPGDPAVVLIPGGAALAAAHDDIARGKAPAGLGDSRDLFSDSIHPNLAGRYYMACVMFACLYRSSPEGLPVAPRDRHGNPMGRVPPPLAAYFQRRAWQVARAEPRAGLS